jgi:RNA polymerase sigma factor (sigma-70 family)
MTAEAQLVSKLKNKDSKAERSLFEEYGAQMKAVCGLYVKTDAEKEDLLQESFIKIFKSIHEFEEKGVIRAWMRRIVVNTCLNYVTRDKYRNNVKNQDAYELADELIDTKEENNDSELDHLIEMIDGEKIHESIANLKEDHKVVFCLYYLDDWSHKAIAAKLNISEGASKVRLLRAKEALKKILTHTLQKGIQR